MQGRPGGAGAGHWESFGRCPPICMIFYLTHDLRLLKLQLFLAPEFPQTHAPLLQNIFYFLIRWPPQKGTGYYLLPVGTCGT